MYDGPELQRSEGYFSLLQLLRLFRNNIEDSLKDLIHFRAEVRGMNGGPWLPGSRDNQYIAHNWEAVLKHKRRRCEELQDRIDRKIREIESLRDGVGTGTRGSSLARVPLRTLAYTPQLFNASAIKEAMKGTHINQILLVFTVVTILYLPPTFVSVRHLSSASSYSDIRRIQSNHLLSANTWAAFPCS